jgi:hypothetical protein
MEQKSYLFLHVQHPSLERRCRSLVLIGLSNPFRVDIAQLLIFKLGRHGINPHGLFATYFPSLGLYQPHLVDQSPLTSQPRGVEPSFGLKKRS